MQKLSEIIYTSVTSTSRRPRWWILALVQVITFVLMGELFRPHRMHPLFLYYLFIAFILLIPATVWLWQDIQTVNLKRATQLQIKIFTRQCLTVGAIIICAAVLIIAARFLYLHWAILAVVSSLIASTATLAMLYAVLVNQTFFKSVVLAIDTWNKKISLAALVAFILILANGASFAFVHGLFNGFRSADQFSVLTHSATIWVLLTAVIFLASFVAAVVNCFLVLLFLEIISLKKDPEAVAEPVKSLAASEAAPLR